MTKRSNLGVPEFTDAERKVDTAQELKELRKSKWYKKLPPASGKSYQERTKHERQSTNMQDSEGIKTAEKSLPDNGKNPDVAPRPTPNPRKQGGLYSTQVTPGKWTTKTK